MYCEYYGFSEEPFQLTPDPSFLYLDEVYREALAHLEYGVEMGKGFILLTGEVGTGKTTLVHSFLERRKEDLITAFVFSTALDFVELLRLIHEDFDTGAKGDSEASLLIELNHFLLKKYKEGKKTVLILDEAQNLDDLLLEKIRMLSNLEATKAKLLQTVLVGQPELARKLEKPELRQLKQRVAVRFDIPPMIRERTFSYIEHRLRLVGAPNRGLFSDDALDLIFRHSQGIPRLINVICSNALLLGFGAGRSRISGRIIEEVVTDLNRGVPTEEKPKGTPGISGDPVLREAIARSAPVGTSLAPPPAARPAEDLPLTADEAAAYLRVSSKTARNLLRSGVIPASKVGRGWRVLREDLDDYVRGVRKKSTAPARSSGPIGKICSEASEAYGEGGNEG